VCAPHCSTAVINQRNAVGQQLQSVPAVQSSHAPAHVSSRTAQHGNCRVCAATCHKQDQAAPVSCLQQQQPARGCVISNSCPVCVLHYLHTVFDAAIWVSTVLWRVSGLWCCRGPCTSLKLSCQHTSLRHLLLWCASFWCQQHTCVWHHQHTCRWHV
jgi:hypothetical protein